MHAQNFSKRPVVQANMLSLPFGNGSFDIVWSIGSLLHIPRDLINVALSEVHRILKKKSIFIASIKKGVGESVDNEGRFFTYYGDTEWAKMLINNHFMISSLEVTPEVRENKTVDWIVSVSINQ
jgi:SAM-dependent methyltransferase